MADRFTYLCTFLARRSYVLLVIALGLLLPVDRALTVRYRFVHGLYQNVLYASLQPTRRAQMSGKVARAIEARFGTDPSRFDTQA